MRVKRFCPNCNHELPKLPVGKKAVIDRELVRTLTAEGLNARQIAERIGVTRWAVRMIQIEQKASESPSQGKP